MKRFIYLLLLLLTVSAVSALPQNSSMSFSLQQTGASFTGTVSIAAAVYQSSSGGTAVATETSSVSFFDSNGVFVFTNTSSIDYSKQNWIGFTFPGQSEMVPRLQLLGSPGSLDNPFTQSGLIISLKNDSSNFSGVLRITGDVKINGSSVCTTSSCLQNYTSGHGINITGYMISINATTCSSGEYSRWNGSEFLCFNDASGGDNTSWNEGVADLQYLGISSTAVNSNQLGGQSPSYYLNTSGGTVNGNLFVNGNLGIVGTLLNFTVSNGYINGTFLPSMNGLFDLGSLSLKWNNVYANSFNGAWNGSSDYSTTAQANQLYAPISTVSDNTSWNESRADVKYLQSYTESDPVFMTANATICQSNGVNCPASSGDNSSWNQSLANTLYASINVISDNTSWNKSYADTLYAAFGSGSDNSSWNESRGNAIYYLRTDGLLDNQSWNETKATTSFYPRNTNPAGFYNVTTLPAYPTADNTSWNQSLANTLYAAFGSGSDNTSWNQSHANTLYASIGIIADNTSWNETRGNSIYASINVVSDNTSWNQSGYYTNASASFYPRNVNPNSYYNSTTLPAYPTADNTSWNQTHASTLYASINVVSDNTSWNQSGATSLFYPRNTNPAGFYNSTSLPAYPTADNTSWNQTHASTLYASINVVSDNTSWNETRGNAIYAPITVTGDNASWNQSGYYTNASSSFYPRNTNPDGFYNVTTLPAYPTADNTSWNETRADAKYLQSYVETDPIFMIANATICQEDGTNCPVSSGDNSSWNQSLANTLYASIGIIGDNTTWNETRGNAIYLGISSTAANSNQLGGQVPTYYLNTTGGTYDNQSWNESGAISQFYPRNTNPAGFYNSTSLPAYPTADNTSWNETRGNAIYASINIVGDNTSWNQSGYYTNASASFYPRNTNPAGFYNSTSLPAYPTADNTSWNQSHANTLYASIGITGDNTSWNQTGATILYYPRNTNPAGFYNSTSLPAYPTADNTSWNQSLATTLYLGISSVAANSNQLAGFVSTYFLNITGISASNITSGFFNPSRFGDSTINSTKLNITNAGSDGQVLTKAANGQFTWADDQTGGGGSVNGSDISVGYINASRMNLSGNLSMNGGFINLGVGGGLIGAGGIDGTGGWTNTSTTTSTSLTVNITGALCMGAESGGVMPCRTGWGDQENQRRYMSIQMDPFLVCGAETGEYGHWGWSNANGGTGTDTTCVAAPDESSLGTISLGSGTLANSNASLITGNTANAGLWVNGSTGITAFFARVRADAVSDGTNNFSIWVGFNDATAVNVILPTDGVLAFYNRSYGGSNGNWSLMTSNTNSRSVNTSNISFAANKWYDIEVQVYNNTFAVMYVNGVEAASLTTNIPSGSGDAFEPGVVRINKEGGPTERRLYLDYYGVYRIFNTPRW